MNYNALFSLASSQDSSSFDGQTDSVALVEVDLDGVILTANQMAHVTWGFEPGSTLSRDIMIALEGVEGVDAVELPLQIGGLHIGALPGVAGPGWVLLGYNPLSSASGSRKTLRSGRASRYTSIRTEYDPPAASKSSLSRLVQDRGPSGCTVPAGFMSSEQETENALRHLATTSPDHTIFSDAGLQLLVCGMRADRGLILLGDGQSRYVVVSDTDITIREASDTDEHPIKFGPLLNQDAFLSNLVRSGVVRRFDADTSHAICTCLSDSDCSSTMSGFVYPIHDNGRPAGLIILVWTEGLPDDAYQEETAGRLFGVFETLYSWISNCTRYSDTVSAIDDGLVRFTILDDYSRSYLFATDQLLHLTGYRAAEIMDTAGEGFDWIRDLVHPDDRSLIRAHTMTLSDGHESRVVYRIMHRDGTVRWLREFASPAGPVRGLQIARGILTDVSEMKAAEEVLLQAKKEAEASNRSKTSFIATLSHEIRTPLGALSGYAELLDRELTDFESEAGIELPLQIREFMDVLTDRSRKIQTLVHDLFELSNVEMGLVELQKSDLSLHALLKKSVSKVRAELEDKGIALKLALECADPIVHSDQHRLEQVFDRVISNAAKFTSSGSVSVRTRREDSFAVIEIEDTGIGISSEYQGELFQIFSQEEDWMDRKFEGTGLGLAFARRVLELLDGQIEVESEKGEGSIFRIRLPLAWT
jgi:PAS domain S-box-containing protein